jgi:hypothetical protein
MIEKPGVYFDMPAADYFADPCPAPSLTQSMAKLLIAKSPLHAKCAHPRLRDAPPEDEPVEKYEKAKAIGSAAHAVMIGRGKDLEIADFDAWRSNDAKAVRENAEHLGKVPILRHHFDLACKLVEAAHDQLYAGNFHAFDGEHGRGEVCVAWNEDGFWLRTLIDWLPTDRRIVWDYKTTEMSAAPHGIGRMMVDMGWDIQAAMHERGLAAVMDGVGSIGRRFRFVVQEQEDPYALTVCELPDAVMEMGRKKLAYAVRLWRACMRSGVWPAYPPEVYEPQYPAWAEQAWLNREVSEAARERHGNGNVLMAG